ncbi:PepSY domain-containing protein [Mesorhizobium abyssinicae]|uniref:PepSY domain-containing protein n=1 Tax=Mesorhizobium abyssinicae TaxID=1209958 RepID=A0ABU5AMQ4_9HYPH|nr:PepSY domain-containing protein [Mesorhizobium abyssinicae]MDX8538563.1 PepSY domain-containing protein [Mesorhizobium abyssinicae]
MIDKIASSAGAGQPRAVKTSSTPSTASPLPGANSFTEDQAKARIESAGYSNVADLAKDNQGIWRGQATAKNGQSTSVALDYQAMCLPAPNERDGEKMKILTGLFDD